MNTLENIITNDLNITLNSFLYNSINLFKFSTGELNNYILNKCLENPLIHIDESKIPLSVLSYKNENQADVVLSEILEYFNCSLSADDQLIMKYIIYSLDSHGFLKAHPKEISDFLSTDYHRVESLIGLLQNYDNRGIGCKDMVSFLSFQLKNKKVYNDYFFSIFISHMKNIETQNYSFLESLDICENEFRSYIEVIKNSCRLFPLNNETTTYIETDASIFIDSNNKFTVHINDHLLDSVTFEPLSFNVAEHDFNRKIENYRKDYEELISILNARKVYLADILTIIINIQGDYLKNTADYLNTLDQNMLSELTSLSPATISRLLHNKYISTPRGIMPIKSLLSKKCYNSASVSYVMYLIRSLSDYENIPDSKISKLLTEKGVSISRRTVNKYKNQLLKQV